MKQKSRAARGSSDTRLYPWGNSAPDCTKLNYYHFNGSSGYEFCVGDTSKVGSYPSGASPYGVLDMAGYVWEWTSNPYKPYPYAVNDGREALEGGAFGTLRGGALDFDDFFARCASRIGRDPDCRLADGGFWVVSPGFGG